MSLMTRTAGVRSDRLAAIMAEEHAEPNTVADPHHFDFDLDRGIREQVVNKLEHSPLLVLARGVGPAGVQRDLCIVLPRQVGLHRQGIQRHHQEQADAAESSQ